MTSPEYLSFHLPEDFIASYVDRPTNFGYPIGGGNSLGELVFFNNYSRLKEDGSKERWHECCQRVVNGYYSILKDHCLTVKTHWNETKAIASAKDAYERMFTFKWLPPGRGLWAMGSEVVNRERNAAPCFNCSFISTEKISSRSVREATLPFMRLMEQSMWGIGVGYDTRGAGNLTLHDQTDETVTHVVEDTREGWATSLGALLESFFFENRPAVVFDYSLLRPAGAPLKRFGGTASGSEPLKRTHEKVAGLLAGREGEELTSRDINDIANLAAKAVVAGGARRSALLCLGEADDKEFVNLKNYEMFSERNGVDGWSHLSNNSVLASVGGSYEHLIDNVANNGEPGFVYLDVARRHGRTGNGADNRDLGVRGLNPCAEIFLESMELCNLSECFPSHHADIDDFKRTLKHAYMYNKAVTLLPTPWPETNEVINRNRRIGLSMSGVVQFAETFGWAVLKTWSREAYDEIVRRDVQYSAWLGVRESIRHSAIKPSGSVSLLSHVTPGVHWPTDRCYIRRMRLRADSPLLKVLSEAGYHTEPDVSDPDHTAVVELPVRGPEVRTEKEVSVWEKVALAAMMQENFADNAVSCTATFRSEESSEISAILRAFEGRLKSISFLPITDGGSYPQMPYSTLDPDECDGMQANVLPIDIETMYAEGPDAEAERGCSNDKCELPV